VGYDGDWKVARIMQPLGKGDWRWSVFAIILAHADITHGHEADPNEARRKVEAAWERATAEGGVSATTCNSRSKFEGHAPIAAEPSTFLGVESLRKPLSPHHLLPLTEPRFEPPSAGLFVTRANFSGHAETKRIRLGLSWRGAFRLLPRASAKHPTGPARGHTPRRGFALEDRGPARPSASSCFR
jgi:hypothetical protein